MQSRSVVPHKWLTARALAVAAAVAAAVGAAVSGGAGGGGGGGAAVPLVTQVMPARACLRVCWHVRACMCLYMLCL